MKSGIDNRWDSLAKSLKKIYSDEKLLGVFESDITYLKKSYCFTEDLWETQFNKTVPKVVMLSEAPLFGENKNYFYNHETKESPFFRFDDARAVAGDDFAQGKSFKHRSNEKKEFLIKTLSENGFLILDLFPYALNEKTALSYQTMSNELYIKIFKASIGEHLCKKLDQLKSKCEGGNPPIFLFRYKRVKKCLNQEVKEVLRNKKLLKNDLHIDSIGGISMSLNRQLLAKAFGR